IPALGRTTHHHRDMPAVADGYVTDDITQSVIDADEIEHFAEQEAEDDGQDNRYIPGLPWDEKEALKGKNESWHHFFRRHGENIRHFLVEDWFTSAALGIITTVLSVVTDLGIESLIHWRKENFEYFHEQSRYYGIIYWVLHFTVCTAIASLCCKHISPQAAGSGIPEVKVIISGFVLDNYLSLKTLLAKMVGLVFSIGGGLPVGKEGPFVHMGAIVAALLSKATSKMRHNAFFTNEAREIEMLSMGCAVGIACTFSAPIGAVLYGIECTSKYFAVKNYWKCFFAAAAAAFSFRFAINTLVPPHIAGTIVAYYQTSFPNEVFIIEELPIFALMGVVCGLMGAFFVFVNRQIFLFQKQNKFFQKIFGQSLTVFAVLWALNMAIWTYPEGLGQFVAGKWTFHVTLADFISNCTFHQMNLTDLGCKPEIVERWTGGDGSLDFKWTLLCFMIFYFVLVAQCITLFIPSGIFVPAFAVGACGGRLFGELLSMSFPEGLRGPGSPPIYPGLYAVVGAAAYTGAVTHSLSLAVIVCETTGQLCALLPVLIALMIANAICSFLSPSIYESTIILKKLPYLADLPPSRISVHVLKVERVMVKDIQFVSRNTTYKELRNMLKRHQHIGSFPFVTDPVTMTLLGSISRRYLVSLLCIKIGAQEILPEKRSKTPSEVMAQRRRSSGTTAALILTGRTESDSHFRVSSPLHTTSPLAQLLPSQSNEDTIGHQRTMTIAERAGVLNQRIEIDDYAIDAAPFQLVKGTSLYKVHTMFSLLGLHHAYVTDRGRLLGVVSLKELRDTFADIYVRGAQLPPWRRKRRATERATSERDVENGATQSFI
ncbi:hypothetical protein PFISCL1PPCAC_8337, partial [Pristionchus fissidentatus]